MSLRKSHTQLCFLAPALALLAFSALQTLAAPIPVTIEPDSYANGQVLDNISPFVTLSTAVSFTNTPTFGVLASTDAAGASTGTNVFAQSPGVTFWNSSRILLMNFHAPVNNISIDYIASGFFSNLYQGRLEAYSATGVLLASDDTALLAGGQHETMTVAAPNIEYAFAYPPLDPFGDLDNLHFTAVPEPTACVLLLIGALTAFARRRRSKSH
jgi:hypothetical protein